MLGLSSACSTCSTKLVVCRESLREFLRANGGGAEEEVGAASEEKNLRKSFREKRFSRGFHLRFQHCTLLSIVEYYVLYVEKGSKGFGSKNPSLAFAIMRTYVREISPIQLLMEHHQ